MKKIFLILLTLYFVASLGFCSTVNSYHSYGRKTGSYRTSGSTTTSYDKYGHKTGTIKQISSGYADRRTETYRTNSSGKTNVYDSTGRRTGSYRTDLNGRITKYDSSERKICSYE